MVGVHLLSSILQASKSKRNLNKCKHPLKDLEPLSLKSRLIGQLLRLQQKLEAQPSLPIICNGVATQDQLGLILYQRQAFILVIVLQ
jgi:hypothetical protein